MSNFIFNFGAIDFSWVTGVATSIYTQLKGPFSALCIVAAAICLLGILFSKDQKKVSEYTAWMKRVIIAFALFFFLGKIFDLVNGIVTEGKGEAWTNPLD